MSNQLGDNHAGAEASDKRDGRLEAFLLLFRRESQRDSFLNDGTDGLAETCPQEFLLIAGRALHVRCTQEIVRTGEAVWRQSRGLQLNFLDLRTCGLPKQADQTCNIVGPRMNAADAIRDVSGTARQALAETRRLLGVLRTDAGQEPRQPLPGLADLDDLVGRVRAAGLPVQYERSGTGANLPPDIQLAVFRLVQEALTNTMKHAGPGATAAVRLQLTPAEVCVNVEDDGAGRAGPGAAGGGLTGMRERISAFGGDLDFGPRHPRGWRVAARLYLDPVVTS